MCVYCVRQGTVVLILAFFGKVENAEVDILVDVQFKFEHIYKRHFFLFGTILGVLSFEVPKRAIKGTDKLGYKKCRILS